MTVIPSPPRGRWWMASLPLTRSSTSSTEGNLKPYIVREGKDMRPYANPFLMKSVSLSEHEGKIFKSRGWSGPWIASITGSGDRSPRGNQGDGGVGAGFARHWQRQWGKRASRGSGSPSQGGRKRSRSILQRDQFWTSMSGPLGGWE